MRIHKSGRPLSADNVPVPMPAAGEVQVKVLACGVCRTDLHIADGDLPLLTAPITPGHEIVGRVTALGAGPVSLRVGQRVGIPWLGKACGHCDYCRIDRENLCDTPIFTGYSRDGGYAEYAVADAAYCIPLPEIYGDAEMAPLLCAGLIGYRAYRRAGDGKRLGLIGFGAAAHILCQLARADGRDIFAVTRPGDTEGQVFARSLGAIWTGGSNETPPEQLDAAIIFAPSGSLVPLALRWVRKGGTVVCAGIHMSDIPSFPYQNLWGEREIVSIANLTREDGSVFMERAARTRIETRVVTYPLAEANAALEHLREGRIQGAAVLIPQ
ncbi:MAG TPA: zinc-dependent alcohol dehydrogenase family protein [Devosia sp.]|nr:zinc-dependent alcohol dehydrogenase family protein [Devosia sp.]